MTVLLSAIKVSVVGTGTMGNGIVQLLSQNEGVDSIIWKGGTLQRAHAGLADIKLQLSRLVAKKRMTEDAAAKSFHKIFITADYKDLNNSNCIIEATSENIDIKREVFSNLAEVCALDTVLASNTSSLSITELASLTKRPDNVVGLHFFNPAPVMKLAEVIAGLTTSKQTIDFAMSFARQLGKDPVLVNEAPGFIVNRMLIPMINEAIGILAEDVASAEEIDKAMRLGANHPIGPLALADLIGNDVNLSIMETLHTETGDPKYRAHPLLRKMVRANRLGRKTGHGFFKY
ncbi:3-hydroxyacyl-CoA dehydrogenase NAD-binding domain-containing protein [Pseudomonas sp. NA-150]|uniref:3-hydroxyacyl-CoA dehydrogenase NAD-binding domain-containing protein n=1 Tax=Pseudomonas sp. NA-150 TaxID=3367525 RepID=UPI0037C86290